MEITQSFQAQLLYLMVNSTSFMRESVSVLDSNLFTDDDLRIAASAAKKYFKIYKRAIGPNLNQELAEMLSARKLPPDGLSSVISLLSKTKKRVNRDYITNKLADFVRARTYQDGVIELAELVAKGDLAEAEETMRTILQTSIEKVDDGVDYATDLVDIEERASRNPIWLPTGIPELDHEIGGFRRPQFVSIAGGYKGGKSWFLTHIGAVALKKGFSVLHITHENSREETIERYDMSLGKLVSGREPKEIELHNKRGGMTTMVRPCTCDVDKVKNIRERIEDRGGRLRVVKFPMGVACPLDIENLIERLDIKYDFVPDVIINDYADIMHKHKDELRHVLNDLYIWHKGLADKMGILVVTASQVKREAIGRTIDERDFSEDSRKAGNIDLGMSICETNNPHERVIYVFGNRNGPQKFGVRVGVNFEIGQVCMWSEKESHYEDKRYE